MKDNEELKIGIILIAAGNSSRLGQMKQSVLAKNKILLQSSIEIAQELSDNIITILGYNRDELADKLESYNTLFNKDWSVGMGSSIALGVKHFYDDTDGVMIMQCDQYRLVSEDYFNLIRQWRNSSKGIVASQYLIVEQDKKSNKVTLGAPAIFSKFYYDELLLLKEKGAKALLTKYSNDLVRFKIGNAAFDLDTPEDLKTFEQYQMNMTN